MKKHPAESILERITSAETVDFVELASIAGLDIRKDFAGADLKNAVLSNADLRGCNFSRTDFTSADLSNVDLTEANLQGANFSLANLEYADLRSANLENAVFTAANLQGAIFLNANIKNATFQDAKVLGETYLNTLRAHLELESLNAGWRDRLDQEMTFKELEFWVKGCRAKLSDPIRGQAYYEREIILMARELLKQLDALHLSQQDAVVNKISRKMSRIVREQRVSNAQFSEYILELENRLAYLKSQE